MSKGKESNIFDKKTQGFYNRVVKRVFDFLLSFILIVLLFPIIILISLIIIITNGFPIFYTPLRGGYKNKPFKIIKFRTMVKNADKIGGATTAFHDPRVTKIGRLLRKTKLDEIPQLFNIFVGQMSFVGPRPEYIDYVKEFKGDELYILAVRPGITDYSSLEFSDMDSVVGDVDVDKYFKEIILPKKNILRTKYVRNISFLVDAKLFFATVFKVICNIFKKRKKMEYVKMPFINKKASRICMGCEQLGQYEWGDTKIDELKDAVKEALKNGITVFDVADCYGKGKAETLLGEAIGNNRKNIIIMSKFGVRWDDSGNVFYDNSPQYIEEAVQLSLKRLNTNYIDVYQLHWRDKVTPIADVVAKLEELKKRKIIGSYGFCNLDFNDIVELRRIKAKYTSIQVEFSLANRLNESLLTSLSKGVVRLTYGSLGQGILSGKYDLNSTFSGNDRRSRPEYVNFHGEKLKNNLKIVDEMEKISKTTNHDCPSIAIRYILDTIPKSIVIVGCKNPQQVKSNCSSIGWKLTKKEINRLRTISEVNKQ